MTASPPFLHLPLFDGPLDLLLHLCKRHELEITELPIALITEQFLAYLDVLEELQIEVAGEFVAMASLLCLLKSRALLPALEIDGEDDDEEGEDPRSALIARLLNYRRYRDASEQLEARDRERREYFVRPLAPREAAGLDALDAPLDVDLTELLGALRDLLIERSKAEAIHAVEIPMMPLEERVEELLDRLAAGPRRTAFERLFDGATTRPLVVVTVLSVLHLARLRYIRLVQKEHLAPITIECRFDPAQRATLTSVTDVG